MLVSGYDKDGNPLMEEGNIIPMDPGSIYVWSEVDTDKDAEGEYSHYQQLKQFGMFDLPDDITLTDEQKEATMKAFRNAVSDDLTLATEPLYGQFSDNDTSDEKIYIYWSGVTGYQNVILQKVDKTGNVVLEGATFNLYRGNSSSIYVWKDSQDKTKTMIMGREEKEDGTVIEHLTSSANGFIWIGELPYGTYYLQETGVPKKAKNKETTEYNGNIGKWFCLMIDDTGTYMSAGYADTDTYSDDTAKTGKEAAKTDVETMRKIATQN